MLVINWMFVLVPTIFSKLTRLIVCKGRIAQQPMTKKKEKKADRDDFIGKQINQSSSYAFLCAENKQTSFNSHNDDTWQSSLKIQHPNISLSSKRKRPKDSLIKLRNVSNNNPNNNNQKTECEHRTKRWHRNVCERDESKMAKNDKRTENVDLLKMNL